MQYYLKKDSLPPELISFGESHLIADGISTSEIFWTKLKGDGSERMLYRLAHNRGSVIVAVNDHPFTSDSGVNENDSFYYLCHHLKAKGIDTPEIYDYQRKRGWLLMEDLGDIHLQDEALKYKADQERLRELYEKVLSILPLIQVKGAQGLDVNRIHSMPYDKNFVRTWESGYFFRSFLKGYLKLDISEDFLNDEFDSLAETLTSMDRSFFLYRDFQSKNIMITSHKIRFLDFQGGRMGPLHYDLASLLLDPYVEIPDTLRHTLMDYYLTQLSALIPIDKNMFLADYPLIALHRNMQILGAFAYLSGVKKKQAFTQYIAPAIKSLKTLCNLDIFSPYKNMRKVVNNL